MRDRMRQVMERTGLSQQDFATRLGVSPASLSNIFVGRTNPTNNHVQAIHRAFPEISVNWLMFGEGDMLGNVSSLGIDGRSVTTEATEPVGGYADDGISFAFEEEASASSVSSVGISYGGSPREITTSAKGNSSLAPSRDSYTPTRDTPQRRIREIRVFFDDGTYEAFVPLNDR